MSHAVRMITVGVALVFSCVACAGGDGASSVPSSASPAQPTRLQDAPEISVNGHPFAALDAARPSADRRAIGDLRMGAERIMAYTEGPRCGLQVIRSNDEKHPVLSLDTAMPKNDDQGNTRFAAGPYLKSSATGSGTSKPWASLSCGRSAMVIENSSQDAGTPSKSRGSLSTIEGPKVNKTFYVAVGEDKDRKKILSSLLSHP
ncbi:hypothetical protein ACFVZE_33930 [Streptomyces anulatus]|uniref:hypothetical protein n=1 Tax=Streptomyces anulatus TaxID=1892 RepID=UPI0036C75719